MNIQKWITALLLCTLMVPGAAFAEEESAEDRVRALEARVEALEAQIAALSGSGNPQAEAPEVHAFSMNEKLALSEGTSMTVTSFDTGVRFKYSPAGGISMLTLSAKSGYRLLCLYVTVDNQGPNDLHTAQLLNISVLIGKDYTNKAKDSLFYQNAQGVYSGGLKSIGPKTTISGCLLFAVPEDVDTSRDRIAVQMVYDDIIYECVLRPSGALLEPGEAEVF